ncbi:MAG: SpoIIE family protein phosphatase [Coriobacteriia bacterium]|nr:SpoIIE family protein phosphatase [Coriobacteriia bacterium]
MDTGARDSRHNVAVLVEIARTVGGQQAAAEAICAHAVAGLGLTGASIGVVRNGARERHLESIAAAGQLSQFIRDMSTPLGTDTDATRTALGGEPIFVGNPHGVGDSEGADGVGRWRNGFGSHAYAILPLGSHEGPMGVLTLEWPEPQPFPAETRSDIQLFADVAALVLRCAPGTPPGVVEHDASPCEDAEQCEFASNSRGLIVPAVLATSWAVPPTARIWTAVTRPGRARESAAFAEVMDVPSAGFMLVAGAASTSSGGDAEEAVRAGRGVMRAAATHGSPPEDVLGMLEGSMRSHQDAAWMSAAAATYDPIAGAVSLAMGGSVALMTLSRQGRDSLTLPVEAVAGSRGAHAETAMRIVLPGDRVALLSGRVSVLDEPAVAAEAKLALGLTGDTGGADAAVRLLSLVCQAQAGAAVIVLEFATGGAPPTT